MHGKTRENFRNGIDVRLTSNKGLFKMDTKIQLYVKNR